MNTYMTNKILISLKNLLRATPGPSSMMTKGSCALLAGTPYQGAAERWGLCKKQTREEGLGPRPGAPSSGPSG